MNNTAKVKIIAEVAQAHEGSLGVLHSYIDALAGTDVDIIKFQVHIAEKESSEHETFRVPFSYVDRTRTEYWRRMGFTKEQWAGIKAHCEDKGVEFLASPFSVAAVQLLEDLGVGRYKIASGETDNFLMLDHIRRTGKEIWISTGMSSYDDIEETLKVLDHPAEKTALFQCTTSYPTPPEEIGLNVIPELARRFGVRSGLSDHSGCIYPSLAAVALGAELIECHAVFDKRMFGPDSGASLTIDGFGRLVKGIRYIEKMIANPVDKDDPSRFAGLKTMFGKALAVNKDLKEGNRINLEDLEDRKPADRGVAARDYKKVIGKEVRSDIKRGEFLTEKDIHG